MGTCRDTAGKAWWRQRDRGGTAGAGELSVTNRKYILSNYCGQTPLKD